MYDDGVSAERSPAGGAVHPTLVYSTKVPAGDVSQSPSAKPHIYRSKMKPRVSAVNPAGSCKWTSNKGGLPLNARTLSSDWISFPGDGKNVTF